MEEAAIGHGAGDGADIVGKLGADEDDDGAVADGVEVGALVFAGHKEGRPSFLKKRGKRLLSRGRACVGRCALGDKSFLLVFFRKKVLAC